MDFQIPNARQANATLAPLPPSLGCWLPALQTARACSPVGVLISVHRRGVRDTYMSDSIQYWNGRIRNVVFFAGSITIIHELMVADKYLIIDTHLERES